MSNKYDLEVEVGRFKPINLSEVLEVHEDRLTEHFAEQASIFGFFSVQLADAERLLNNAKVASEREYAECDAYYRDEYRKLDQKYTEAVIRGDVLLDEDYQKAMDIQHQAKYDVDIVKAMVNALRMKADMLISMGAHLRQEYDMTGMTIREQSMDKEVDKVKKAIKLKRNNEQV
jgi:hypothetical protein